MSLLEKNTSSIDVDNLVTSNDIGGRKASGIPLNIILCVAFLWALFQVWIASPFPYMMDSDLLRWNSNQARSIHLAFAIFIVFLSFPFSAKSSVKKIPLVDWLLAISASLSALYYLIEYDNISTRVGAPILQDIIVACIGIPLLFEAARRSLGITLPLIATVFLGYNFFGNYMPEMIAHKGFGLQEVVNHQWITTEGVFGIALGVSTDFVFLFVLFGSLLDKAGAGNYFIKLAFSCLGHFRGGPAKAAVVASGLTGLISGSSIANVVTTGTFTIPMMKKVGFSAEKAGAVEVAASVNGQIMPPVMGAAAFLMVEYVGISYLEVIKHAFLPALISYIGLVYIVHLEAIKANMQGLPKSARAVSASAVSKVTGFLFGFLMLCATSAAVYFGLGWIKQIAGDNSIYVVSGLVISSFFGLLYAGCKLPKLSDDIDQDLSALPPPGEIFRSGLYYLLPVVVLVWCLMIERLSPGLSAFWASLLTMFMIVTKPVLETLFRQEERDLDEADKQASLPLFSGLKSLADGMISGARNMASISIATATAGVIVGVVSQTSVGAVLADVVEVLSFGNITLMLLLVAVLCMILGMGLPTTANYIVVSSLMANVIVEVGASNGLVVPLIAVHLFVFYFGLMADVTPPVGLASFAAAAVSGGKPIQTGIIAFKYALRTAVLPFLFIFNPDLLLINVTVLHGIFIFIIATLAMLIFTAATQGYFFDRCKLWERGVLLLIAFSIFRPDFWINQMVEPHRYMELNEYLAQEEQIPVGTPLRIHVEEDSYSGEKDISIRMLIAREQGSASEVIAASGLNLYQADELIEVDSVDIGSDAYEAGFEAFQVLVGVDVANKQPSTVFVYLPCVLLIVLIALSQRKTQRQRQKKREGLAA
ncbi:C4-dicarboxylate ABC transporter [Marinomonas ushuaiensis DSM 15871]|uniref:C4-dicarboxylate ABC transporter n=1 Tax=Marinomonas ushuaiensis DSM 15871 TaxID=1122207 RepID=X7E162_9GAMM|nr:TRAP transporter permease [Marinomonas ushuaiensis]ETX09814.1 C4-dicarboxylate ABC transporter [Marinomonas ushuaiensis DSM 15871]